MKYLEAEKPARYLQVFLVSIRTGTVPDLMGVGTGSVVTIVLRGRPIRTDDFVLYLLEFDSCPRFNYSTGQMRNTIPTRAMNAPLNTSPYFSKAPN
jgi:hypothetical protein